MLHQAFIEALLSTAGFFPKIVFFLLAKSVNFDLQIPQKCISDTVFDFKAYIVHRLPREYYGLVTKHIKSHHPNWCIKVSNTPPWLPCWCSYYFFFCNQTWQGQSVMFSLKLLLKKKTLRPLFMDGVQLSQGYTVTTRRQFAFSHWVPRASRYSFGRPQKDKRLSWPWSHATVLNLVTLDWKSSTLMIRPLLV